MVIETGRRLGTFNERPTIFRADPPMITIVLFGPCKSYRYGSAGTLKSDAHAEVHARARPESMRHGQAHSKRCGGDPHAPADAGVVRLIFEALAVGVRLAGIGKHTHPELADV